MARRSCIPRSLNHRSDDTTDLDNDAVHSSEEENGIPEVNTSVIREFNGHEGDDSRAEGSQAPSQDQEQNLSVNTSGIDLGKLENSKLFKKFMEEEKKTKQRQHSRQPTPEPKDPPAKTKPAGPNHNFFKRKSDVLSEPSAKPIKEKESTQTEGLAPPAAVQTTSPSPPQTVPTVSASPNGALGDTMVNVKRAMSGVLENLIAKSPSRSLSPAPLAAATFSEPKQPSVTAAAPSQDPSLISHYQGLLQQATSQMGFQSKRTKELEQAIAAQKAKSTKLLGELKAQAEAEVQGWTRKLDDERREKEEWKARHEKLELEYKKLRLDVDQEKQATGELARKMMFNDSNKAKMGQIEEGLRKCVGQLTSKTVAQESEIRQKEERVFSLQAENQQLRTELGVQKEIIERLKCDYSGVFQKRTDSEMAIQGLKSQIYADDGAMRKLQQELDRLALENASLADAKAALEGSLNEVKAENGELNRTLAKMEKDNAALSSQLEKLSRDYQSLEISSIKANSTIEMQNETIASLQEDYNKLVTRHKESFSPLSPGRKNAHQRRPPIPALPLHVPAAAKSTGATLHTEASVVVPSAPVASADLKTRYNEYRSRQNESCLGQILRWDAEPSVGEKNVQAMEQGRASRETTTGRPQAHSHNPSYSGGEEVQIGSQRKSPAGEQPSAMPTKTKVIVTFPSNQKFEANREQIDKVQKNLVALQGEKAQLESEYAKFGQRGEKSFALKKRKQELEFEIDLADKNIQRLKQKLREFNAF